MQNSSLVLTYLAERESLMSLRKELDLLGDYVMEIGLLIKEQPEKFRFSHQTMALPVEAFFKNDLRVVDSRAWPGIETVATLLVKLHHGREALHDAWHAIPLQYRHSLSPPYDLIRP